MYQLKNNRKKERGKNMRQYEVALVKRKTVKVQADSKLEAWKKAENENPGYETYETR